MRSAKAVRNGLLLCLRAILLLAAPDALYAQAGQPRIVVVVTLDSAGVRVPGVEVTLAYPSGRVLATGRTDSLGGRVFRLELPDGDLEMIGRRIGYARASRFVRVSQDTVVGVIPMRTVSQQLAAIRVEAREDLKRKSYYIDADAIAASHRNLIDATDIISKLRPDMLKGRSATCALSSIWINGKRVDDPPLNDMLLARVYNSGRWPQQDAIVDRGRLAGGALSVLSVLATIHPEHISEMRYVDCFTPAQDTRRGVTSALFVVLKYGVEYEPGRGTYVPEAP